MEKEKRNLSNMVSMVGGFLCYFLRSVAFVCRGNDVPERHTRSSHDRRLDLMRNLRVHDYITAMTKESG